MSLIKQKLHMVCLILGFWMFFNMLNTGSIYVAFTSRSRLSKYPVNGSGESKSMNKYFNFTVLNSICRRDKNMLAIVPVYSAVENFRRRQAIRETLGNNCIKFRCKLFFIIGATRNNSLINGLQTELKQHHDTLVINRIDTYRDLNNKVVAMLDWLVQYCSQPKYVIHIIDDAYPNLAYFIEHMSSMPEGGFILGEVVTGAAPFRDRKHKWFVSHSEYPFIHYPKYIIGVAYGFLNRDTRYLRHIVRNVENMWIEDVWFTGIVSKKAKFKLVPTSKKLVNEPQNMTFDDRLWEHYFCIHNVDENTFYKVYNATL